MTTTFQAFSAAESWALPAQQFALAVVVPSPPPAGYRITIPWHIDPLAGGWIPGVPRLFIAAGEQLSTAQTSVDGDLTEVLPTSVDTSSGEAVAVYELTAEQVAPYAGSGTDPLTSGIVLRTNLHKEATEFPTWTTAEWFQLPPENNIGLVGVTVGSETGPITVDEVTGAVGPPPFLDPHGLRHQLRGRSLRWS